MAEFDIAIVGTSLLSGLLAGVLARDHGKTVVRVGRPRSSQRLPRSLDLALPLATRPESWRMMRRAETESRTLLGSIGLPDAVTAIEMDVLGDLPQTIAGLDHIAHLALGYGHQVHRVQGGWAFRRITTLARDSIERRLGEWLLATGAVDIAEGHVDATTTILADDDAIFDAFADGDRPALLASQVMTSTLIVAPRSLPTPVRRFADHGVTLMARPGNTVLAIVSGEDDVDARLASTLPGPFPMKRLATTRFRRLTTRDGAPLIGTIGPNMLIAGLGDTAPFFAPAIARLVVAKADDHEQHWFAAHDPAGDRATITDLVPTREAVA